MTDWIPTNELQFVERSVLGYYYGDSAKDTVIRRILQQKWERYESEWYEGVRETEWRDIPVVEEE
jgi:hypothetical protein